MSVNLFDVNFYRAANPDLAEFNNSQALSHFKTFGLNEGREFSPFVNLTFYRSSNSDLANFKNKQTYDHLRNHGVAEGRSFSPFVELNFYQDANSDLANFNNEQVFKHLRDYGITEERRFSPFVDLNFYRAANSDLTSLNNKQALQHFEIYGLNEGRDFSLPFDVDYYRSRYSDLLVAGLNNSQLLQHFELHGLNEGRASSTAFNVSYYLSNNPDLIAAGFNFKQAYDHFVLYGYNEERLGVAPQTQQWRQEFGSSTADRSNDVAVDSVGNVYITGLTYGSLAENNAGGSDGWVAKYNNSGDRLWIHQFGTSSDDNADNIGVDSIGNVYITGETNGSLGGTNAGNIDAWLAKYDTSGNRLWIQQFGTSNNDSSRDLAVDSAGNVSITGVIDEFVPGNNNPGDTDAWLAKYDTSGNRQWLQQLNTSSDESYTGVAFDSAGNVYVTAQTNLDGSFAKYGSSGNRLWIQQSSISYNDVAVDSVDNIYITGQELGNALLAKYDSSGKRLWTQNQTGTDLLFPQTGSNFALDLVVETAGSVYMLTESITIRATIINSVRKYDASSGYRLGTQYSASESFNPPISGLAVDNASNFYLTGRFFNFSEPISEDAWVAKFS